MTVTALAPAAPVPARPGLAGCNLKFALRLSPSMACNIWAHPLLGLASSTAEACLRDCWISGSHRGPAARAGPGLARLHPGRRRAFNFSAWQPASEPEPGSERRDQQPARLLVGLTA